MHIQDPVWKSTLIYVYTYTQVCMYVCIYSCTLVHSNALLMLEEWNGYALNDKFHISRSNNIQLHCIYVCMYNK